MRSAAARVRRAPVEAAAQALRVVEPEGGDALADGGHVDGGGGAAGGSTTAPPGAALSGVAPPGRPRPAAGTPDAAWLGVF